MYTCMRVEGEKDVREKTVHVAFEPVYKSWHNLPEGSRFSREKLADSEGDHVLTLLVTSMKMLYQRVGRLSM